MKIIHGRLMLFLKLRTRYKAQLAFYDLNGFMKILDTVWVPQSRTSLKDHMTLTCEVVALDTI